MVRRRDPGTSECLRHSGGRAVIDGLPHQNPQPSRTTFFAGAAARRARGTWPAFTGCVTASSICTTTRDVLAVLLLLSSSPLAAQTTPGPADRPAEQKAVAPQAPAPPPLPTVTCESKPGERTQCPADTSAGVVLLRSTGEAPCLLGKTWGYDQTSVWVSDGCSAEFGTGTVERRRSRRNPSRSRTFRTSGFLLVDGDKGQIYFRLFSYGRYLNQRNLDESYVDAFGNTKTVQRRQDVQLQKFFAPFSGWFLTPKMRYYLYVWSSNPSQGDPAQVVGAGNLSWTFNRHVSVGVGITSLPSVRSTEGQFPYWLGVDNRLIADEFFRGSYTSGVWLKGEFHTKVKYQAMFANNLSTLGVSAAQLDNKFDTQSYVVTWLPTTGEFGLWNTFGDYDDHQKVATRIGVHYTSSHEEKQSQPGTEGIENSQIRLTRRQRHLHARSVWPWHHRHRRGLPDVERRCGRQVQGPVTRGRVLLALVEQLHRRQHGRHPRHQRPWLSAAGVRDGRSQDSPAVLRRITDLRRLRRPVGSARRRELVRDERARHSRSTASGCTWMARPWDTRPTPTRLGAKGTVFHVNLEMNF